MKATTTRPARRIPAARLARVRATAAAKAEARELAFQARQDAAEQLLNPTPEFAPVTRLTLLPGGLHWSAKGQVPAIGATVQVQGRGQAQVKDYCHAAGFLGLVVEPQEPASKPSRRKALAARANCVFGYQLAIMQAA